MVKMRRSLARLGNAGNTALVLRIVLGAIFIVAGAGKLLQGSQFLPLAGYAFLPQNIAYLLDLILPWAELTLGILILTGYYYNIILFASILFTGAFIGANCYSLLTGNTAPCNCFGGILPLTHWQSLIIDILMLMISVFLLATTGKSSIAKLGTMKRQYAIRFSRALLLSLLLIAVSVPSIGYADTPDPGSTVTYPTMKFNAQQLAQREAAFLAAPSIALSSGLGPNSATVATPTSFTLLPYLQYTPSQRNQGSVGNCWVWAGTGLMEIALNVNNSIKDRLSIQYFDSNYTGGWAGCGGWLGEVADFYNSPATDMAIPWSNTNANYQDSSRGGCPNTPSVTAGSIVTTPNYPTTNHLQVATVSTTRVGSSAAIANIQATLLQNKAIEFDFDLPTSADWNNFFSFWGSQAESAVWTPDSSYGTADSGAAGHGVLCVGYDMTDPNNPYWIMLNSWGTTSKRPNGLFRVSMNMNYDSTYRSGNRNYQSFVWSTLNNVFAPAPTPGPAAKLSFTTQPSASNTAGSPFGTQPVVKVQDAGGNTVTASAAVVTLAITAGTGTGGAALSGTTILNAVNGVVSFNGLSINQAGTGYTLTATSSGLTSTASAGFNVAAGTAIASVFVPSLPVSPGAQFTVNLNVQPNNSIAGAQFNLSFDPSLVSINNISEGNLLKQNGANTFFGPGQMDNSGGTVTGMYGAILSAGQSVSASGTFAVITLTAGAAAGICPLTLSNAIIGDVNGHPLPATTVNGQVTIALPAINLAFTTQPSAANTAGTVFVTQPVVNVLDAGGNTLTTSNAAVTLAITGGTGTSGATLSGTTTVNAVNGVATFSGLSIDLAGTGFTLTATSTGLTSVASTSFNVSAGNSGSYYVATFSNATSPNVYAYYDMNGVSNYTIQSGDYLQYDILWTSTNDFSAFDYTCTDGTTLRDSSSLDQNGLNTHPLTNLSSRAYNTWYSRKIALPAGQVGKTISYYDIVCDGTGTKAISFKNIRITDVNGVTRKMILVGDEASVSTTPHLVNQGNLVSFVRSLVASKLAFTTPPSASNTAGMTFTVQPVVKVQDTNGNMVTTSNAAVTLAITGGTGTSDAVLSGAATVNSVNGIATFSGLSIDLAGNGYTLTATSTGLTSAGSTSFNVNPVPPPATKLAFTAQPGAVNTAGIAFNTQPVVKVQDVGGNTVTTSNAAVTLAITGATGTSGAILSGTTTVNAVNGVAIFSGLSINFAGTGYTLTATSTGLTSVASTSFNVSAGNSGSYYVATFSNATSPNVYAYYDMNGVSNYTIQSGDYLQYDILWTSTNDFSAFDYTCTDGTTLRDSSSLDQNGLNTHPLTNLSSRAYNTWYSRKIALPAGQVGKTISYYDIVGDGTGTKAISFKNIRITDVNGVTRKMILVGDEASVSTTPHLVNQGSLVSFVRTLVGAKVAFTTQPSAANTAGTVFVTQPVVNVLDAGGNTVTTSNAAVTLAITGGTGTSGATLSGTTTVNAVNGVATFSGLSINLAGNGYTLTATSAGLTSATSTIFNVSGGSYYIATFNNATSPNVYAYYDMNGVSNYTIQSGDYLQYDILWTSTSDFSAFDYTCTDGTTLRDSSSLDQNGLNTHPLTNLSSRAYNTWYSRKIALPAGQVGKTISYYDIVGDGTGTKAISFKNIRITDVNGVTRKMILVGDEASVSTTPHLVNQGSLVSFVRN